MLAVISVWDEVTFAVPVSVLFLKKVSVMSLNACECHVRRCACVCVRAGVRVGVNVT